jgi:hypothetical protein
MLTRANASLPQVVAMHDFGGMTAEKSAMASARSGPGRVNLFLTPATGPPLLPASDCIHHYRPQATMVLGTWERWSAS